MNFLNGTSGRGDRELARTRGCGLPVSGCSSRQEIRYLAHATVRADWWKHSFRLSGLGGDKGGLWLPVEWASEATLLAPKIRLQETLSCGAE